MVSLLLTPGTGTIVRPGLALLDGVDGGSTLGDLGYRGKQRVEKCAEEADLFVLT